jgi:tetratricopeptide (TPR) repeat protein
MADTGRLDELKRKFDDNPKRYFAPLANEYRKAGEAELAIELCRTYLPQQLNHMSGYIVYGQALHDAGHADESAAVFKQALTLDPENIIALRHLGDIARDGGDKVGAMRWYGKVLELDPRNEEIASYITALANPGAAPAPASGPERQPPPAIRPEPEHDETAVSLEDIVSEPDVEQTRYVAEETAPFQGSASYEDFADDNFGEAQPSAEDRSAFGASVEDAAEEPFEPFEPFTVTDWPTAENAGMQNQENAAEEHPVLEGPWHADPSEFDRPAGDVPADDVEATIATIPSPTSAPVVTMPEEPSGFTPMPVADALSDQPDSPSEGDENNDTLESEPASMTSTDSPFITETMAELYARQGLHAEALDIYRQIVAKRDDPVLRQKIADLELAANQSNAGETVRDFFVRIGALHPSERVRMAAAKTSSLDSLFATTPANSEDLTAAQRFSEAFGGPSGAPRS